MRLALLGDPVAHSRSPAIHAAALAAVGIEGTYEARQTDDAGVVAACAEIRDGSLHGANVTMPLKAAAAENADQLSPDAQRIGAVNTLVADNGSVAGRNTDITGLRSLLDEFPAHEVVVVLGNGSSAAAALVAAAGRSIVVSARRLGAAEGLVRSVGVDARVGEWGRFPGGVLVNATPIGMRGEVLPDGWTDGLTGLIDLPYGDQPTPAVVEARSLGVPVFDGIGVLVAQAAGSFTLWTGLEAPIDVMRQAVRR